MMKIGLTGGIGSGKSTVGRVFEQLGAPVYKADDHAKELYRTDKVLQKQVIELLGEKAYTGGELNRTWIAKQVFQDQVLLAKLNALVHPAVGRDFYAWIEKNPNAPYLIKEAAILFESGAHLAMDRIIHVYAPLETRLSRVVRRDGISNEDVQARIDKQWTDEQRRAESDYEIVNDGLTLILPQILKIHEDIISQSNS